MKILFSPVVDGYRLQSLRHKADEIERNAWSKAFSVDGSNVPCVFPGARSGGRLDLVPIMFLKSQSRVIFDGQNVVGSEEVGFE